MAAKKTIPAKRDDPEESKRFLETAKAVEASDDPKEFDRAFTSVVLSKGTRSQVALSARVRRRRS